jgi:glutamyl-tRNA synthetase
VIVTRFAPSPTGDLHLGGVWTALASHALGGRRILRFEDIDTPRVVEGSQARIEEDLAWLGLSYDRGPRDPETTQSERMHCYAAAIAELTRLGLTYLCDCSRAEIARISSAPHAGEDRVYPGTCRELAQAREMRRPPTVRLRIPRDAIVHCEDPVGGGALKQHVHRDVGDFVLMRGDGLVSYQLAVSIDDSEMGITHVVRGRDLLASTPRQTLLLQMLGMRAPAHYIHVPLVLDAQGERLAKRTAGARVRDLREAGISASEILATLAHGLGLGELPPTLVPNGAFTWARASWNIPKAWAKSAPSTTV